MINSGARIPGRRLLLGLTLFLALAACVFNLPEERQNALFPPFLPWTEDSAAPVQCQIVVAQQDILVSSEETHYQPSTLNIAPTNTPGGFAALLAGALFDAAVEGGYRAANAAKRHAAENVGAPLVGHGIGVTYADSLLRATKAAISHSAWLHPVHVETRRATIDPNEGLPPGALLRIELSYALSWDARSFILTARLSYYRDTSKKALTFQRAYLYFSEPVGPDPDKAAVTRWAAGGDAALRGVMADAITQLIQMIKMDFLAPELAGRDLQADLYRVRFFDQTDLQDAVVMGRVISRSGARMLFQSNNGNLISLVPISVELVKP
jgi:hypothetical protein